MSFWQFLLEFNLVTKGVGQEEKSHIREYSRLIWYSKKYFQIIFFSQFI